VWPGTYHVGMLKLQDAYLKLERAKGHIEDLEKAQGAYFGSEPYKGAPEYDPTSNMTFFVLKDVPEIPRAISLYIGDAAHNLRTALDYLACALVRHSGTEPGSVYFPIAENAERYADESPKRTKGMAPDVKQLIDDLKPHGQGNLGFYVLHLLDIIDKHRMLPIFATSVESWNVRLAGQKGIVGFNMPHNRNSPFGLKKGDTIGSIFGNHAADKEMSVTVLIAFREPYLLEGLPVLRTLKELAAMVEGTLRYFESKLATPAAAGQKPAQRSGA
jgi:hypothetical protein